MAIPTTRGIQLTQGHQKYSSSIKIKCVQLNLQHSKNATYNLTQIILQENIDIAFVQEPYSILNKVAGFPKSFKIFTQGNGRRKACIILNNYNIDVISINQISNEDCVAMEFIYQNLHFYGASMYFDCGKDIGRDIEKMGKIIDLAKDKGIILCMDSNARSKLWHDITTNQRGRTLEEFLIISDLFLINENTGIPTFETARGCSWIDLTLCNNLLVRSVKDWTCGDEESCSDHKLIHFNILKCKQDGNVFKHIGKRYIIKSEDFSKFEEKLASRILTAFDIDKRDNLSKCDEALC